MRRLAEDPRRLALASAALVAAGLWAAAWSAMGRGDLAALCLPLGIDLGAVPGVVTADAVAATALMWVLMMSAMMLPSAAPMIAVYAGLAAREEAGPRLAARVGLFALGYLALWSAVALAGAGAQLLFRGWAAGTPAPPVAAGLLLVAAGAWQFSAVKQSCLRKCRLPVAFLMSHWRDGMAGALPLGARHGMHCLGCCVGLMGLMFVFGAMNLGWMALIALYCLAERVLPGAERWSRWVGGALIAAGAAVLAAQVI